MCDIIGCHGAAFRKPDEGKVGRKTLLDCEQKKENSVGGRKKDEERRPCQQGKGESSITTQVDALGPPKKLAGSSIHVDGEKIKNCKQGRG